MPKETIELDLIKQPPIEAISEVIALIVHYDTPSERIRLVCATTRALTVIKAGLDIDWASDPQLVRPSHLLMSDEEALNVFKSGLKRAIQRMVVAREVVGPHLPGHTRTDESRTVEGGIYAALEILGLGDGTAATLKDRVWRHVKPVAHLARELLWWISYEATILRENQSAPVDLGVLFLQALTRVDPVVVVVLAENTRNELPFIRQFHISEGETIRILPYPVRLAA